MATKKTVSVKLTDEEQVATHIHKLEPALAEIVMAIRQIMMSTNSLIKERIKWNNPSFYYAGEMAPFDPKEHKSDIAVFNLFKGRIMLVLPSGARVSDTSGLLEGDYKDGRRTIVFKDMDDVKGKEVALSTVVKRWVELVGE